MNMKRAVRVVIGEVRREVEDLGREAHLRERFRSGRADQIRASRRRQQRRCALNVLETLMEVREVNA